MAHDVVSPPNTFYVTSLPSKTLITTSLTFSSIKSPFTVVIIVYFVINFTKIINERIVPDGYCLFYNS